MPRSVRLKDHWAEQRLFGRRVIASTIVIFLCLGALTTRLVYLQVFRHAYFSDLSQGNRIRIDPIPPPRGLIYDRNGTALALNRPAYQLELIREQTPDVDAAKQQITNQQGNRQFCGGLSTTVVENFVKKHPWSSAPEPGAA